MTVFVYPNFEKLHSLSCTVETCGILSKLGCKILLPDFAKDKADFSGAEFLSQDEAAKSCDIMISIGGDGTILKCAGMASMNRKELLGINCGRLGFMASLELDELECLKALIEGNYRVEERMMISAGIIYNGGEMKKLTALNEAVISNYGGRGIHDFTVRADGITVSSLRADGLIFSTPTGASGYSLSAGGPLIEPTLDCIEFTQICPHSLFARTMLFSPDKKIEIRFHSDGRTKAGVSVDGSEPIALDECDMVTVERADERLRLIDIRGGSYFRAINSKLMQPAKPQQ